MTKSESVEIAKEMHKALCATVGESLMRFVDDLLNTPYNDGAGKARLFRELAAVIMEAVEESNAN